VTATCAATAQRALGIEHVGRSDAEILNNARQLKALLRLTAWLRCRFGIKVSGVIGHNESLSSPYHHENVARLRSRTHDDFQRAAMQIYRRKLRRLRCRSASQSAEPTLPAATGGLDGGDD